VRIEVNHRPDELLRVVVDRLVPLGSHRDDRRAGNSGGDGRGGRAEMRRALGAEQHPDRHGDVGESLGCVVGGDLRELADGGMRYRPGQVRELPVCEVFDGRLR